MKLKNYLNEANIDWNKFQKMLDTHDWYFDMASDHNAWKRGVESSRNIATFIKSLSGEDKERATWMKLKAMKDKRIPLTREADSEYNKLRGNFE